MLIPSSKRDDHQVQPLRDQAADSADLGQALGFSQSVRTSIPLFQPSEMFKNSEADEPRLPTKSTMPVE
jgi:hypothetical protein